MSVDTISMYVYAKWKYVFTWITCKSSHSFDNLLSLFTQILVLPYECLFNFGMQNVILYLTIPSKIKVAWIGTTHKDYIIAIVHFALFGNMQELVQLACSRNYRLLTSHFSWSSL